MATEGDTGANGDMQEAIILIILAIVSLTAGFAIGIVGGNMFHPSRMLWFLLSFGAAFAIFLLLFAARSAMAFLGRQ